jgi:hypothetical protein
METRILTPNEARKALGYSRGKLSRNDMMKLGQKLRETFPVDDSLPPVLAGQLQEIRHRHG